METSMPLIRCTTSLAGVALSLMLYSCGSVQPVVDSVDTLPLAGYFASCGNIVKLEQREKFCAIFTKSIYGRDTSTNIEGPNQLRSILIPSDTAVQAHLQKLGVTEVQFWGSVQADDLVKRSVIQGRPLENTTSNTLAGGTISFTKVGDKLLANGQGVVTGNAPDREKLRTFYFYRIDAVLE
jgi:hypothetical protein